MGRDDFADFARQYYPVFNKKALIIDVRSNGGGPFSRRAISARARLYSSVRPSLATSLMNRGSSRQGSHISSATVEFRTTNVSWLNAALSGSLA